MGLIPWTNISQNVSHTAIILILTYSQLKLSLDHQNPSKSHVSGEKPTKHLHGRELWFHAELWCDRSSKVAAAQARLEMFWPAWNWPDRSLERLDKVKFENWKKNIFWGKHSRNTWNIDSKKWPKNIVRKRQHEVTTPLYRQLGWPTLFSNLDFQEIPGRSEALALKFGHFLSLHHWATARRFT